MTQSFFGPVGRIHNRMPVILDKKYFKLWLDRGYTDVKELKRIIQEPYPASKMKAEKVEAEYLYDRGHQDKRCWQK